MQSILYKTHWYQAKHFFDGLYMYRDRRVPTILPYKQTNNFKKGNNFTVGLISPMHPHIQTVQDAIGQATKASVFKTMSKSSRTPWKTGASTCQAEERPLALRKQKGFSSKNRNQILT